jgi:methionyl-tRNA synthetase
MKTRYGTDAFRYYLLREMAFGQDAVFSDEALVARVNADLADNFGNLANRVLRMQQRYFAGAVQPLASTPAPEDAALRAAFATARGELAAHMDAFAFHRALESIWQAMDHANRYVQTTAPFRLAADAATRPRAGHILHELLEALRAAAELTAPFVPESAQRLWSMLGLAGEPRLEGSPPWGRAFAAGHLTAAPQILFPRIETEAPG